MSHAIFQITHNVAFWSEGLKGSSVPLYPGTSADWLDISPGDFIAHKRDFGAMYFITLKHILKSEPQLSAHFSHE